MRQEREDRSKPENNFRQVKLHFGGVVGRTEGEVDLVEDGREKRQHAEEHLLARGSADELQQSSDIIPASQNQTHSMFALCEMTSWMASRT